MRRGLTARGARILLPEQPREAREDLVEALKAEHALLKPFFGRPSDLRARVNDLERRIHELTSLPLRSQT